VHWADRGTRDLLSYLVRALTAPNARARVLIILTNRSDEFPRGSPVRRWLGELARRPSVSWVDVEPLDRAEVGQQLTALGTFDSHAGRKFFGGSSCYGAGEALMTGPGACTANATASTPD